MNAPASAPIHPPPIHRSKSLWLGILVITFLAWAWHDSTQWQTILRHRQYALTHADSGISLADWKVDPHRPPWGRYPITQDDPIWSRPHIDSPELFRSTGDPKQLHLYYNINADWRIYEARNSAARHFNDLLTNTILPGLTSGGIRSAGINTLPIIPDSRAIFIPHWLIIAAFLIPWLTFLIWRHRRLRHHLTKTAQ